MPSLPHDKAFFEWPCAWAPVDLDASSGFRDWFILSRDGDLDIPDDRAPDDEAGEVAVRRFGKAATKRLLDGVLHDDMPRAAR